MSVDNAGVRAKTGPEAPITVRYFAAARAAAGRESEQVTAATLDALESEVAGRHGGQLATVLRRCTYLVDGVAVADKMVPLAGHRTVDVLPPFAGG